MKNPFDGMSPRWIRVIFTMMMLTVLAIVLVYFVDVMFIKTIGNDQCAWRPLDQSGTQLLITDVVLGGVAERAGIRNGDILLEVNGPFKSSQEAQRRINAVRPGEYATYLVQRGDHKFETKVEILRSVNTPYLAQFLLGLGFLIVGYVVVLSRPQGKIQRRFARYCMVTMLFFGLASLNLSVDNDAPWKLFLLGNAFLLAHFLVPATFVRFFFHFPVHLKNLDRKWVSVTLYLIGAVLCVPFVPMLVKVPLPFIRLAIFLSYSFYFVGLGIFTYSYFKEIDKSRRKQLRPILIGVGVGASAFAYSILLAAWNPFVIFLQPALLLPGILIPVVPIFFGYAVFRYRLMDIDIVIRRSLLYSVITAIIAALYILIVYGVGNFVAYAFGTEENRAVNLFALVVIAFTFEPLKQRIQEWIDRFFYRERYDYQKALLEFSQELPRQMNLEQILESMVNRISNTMHIDKVAVILCDEQLGCVSMNIERECCVFAEEHAGLLSILRHTKKPQSFELLAEEAEAVGMNRQDREKLLRGGVVLSIPMLLKDRLIGIINVGPKKSGKVYSQEDIDLLSTVASQAAVAIENSRLHQSEIEKQLIKEELSLARKIQEGLLPKGNPDLPGLDIAGISIPATTVGGDYFDFIQLNPHKLLVVVADVSGKGMSAALYMSKIQGMVQLAAHMYNSPKEMLVHVNRRIFDGIERKSFITMILALFDMEKQKVRICRAGHNKALIGTNGALEYLDAPGIGLGLERGPVFESELREVVRPLGPDSLFLFYTDGLTEAMNRIGAQFGEEAIEQLIRARRNLRAAALQQTIVTAVEEFRGGAEQHDDLTMVVVKGTQKSRRVPGM